MKHYHKINFIFKRDMTKKDKPFTSEYSCMEYGYLKNNIWEFTEKVDGTNIVIEYSPENGIIIGGRTERAQIPADLYLTLTKLFVPKLELFMNTFDKEVYFYGEGYGPKIQKGGGNYRSTPGFVLFDIFCSEIFLTRESCVDIAKKFGLDAVPVVGECK